MTVLLAGLSLLAALAAHAAPEPAWRTWDDGLGEAGSSGRSVLVNVYTDWCGWCRRMERDVYGREDVREYLASRFVTIRLNAESRSAAHYEGKSHTSRSLAARFRVTGYPSTIFLDSSGTHLVNVPGYVPPDRFLLLLRYIGEGYLERGVRFQDFMKQESPAEPTR